jgi:hypothetical protein
MPKDQLTVREQNTRGKRLGKERKDGITRSSDTAVNEIIVGWLVPRLGDLDRLMISGGKSSKTENTGTYHIQFIKEIIARIHQLKPGSELICVTNARVGPENLHVVGNLFKSRKGTKKKVRGQQTNEQTSKGSTCSLIRSSAFTSSIKFLEANVVGSVTKHSGSVCPKTSL